MKKFNRNYQHKPGHELRNDMHLNYINYWCNSLTMSIFLPGKKCQIKTFLSQITFRSSLPSGAAASAAPPPSPPPRQQQQQQQPTAASLTTRAGPPPAWWACSPPPPTPPTLPPLPPSSSTPPRSPTAAGSWPGGRPTETRRGAKKIYCLTKFLHKFVKFFKCWEKFL